LVPATGRLSADPSVQRAGVGHLCPKSMRTAPGRDRSFRRPRWEGNLRLPCLRSRWVRLGGRGRQRGSILGWNTAVLLREVYAYSGREDLAEKDRSGQAPACLIAGDG
jgi:hypothetical protein